MPTSPPVFRLFGGQPKASAERERGSASARGYGRDWQRVRDAVLRDEPLCRFCLDQGRTTAATEVDHIETIRARPDLRLVRSNLRPLCHECHSARTAGDRWG